MRFEGDEREPLAVRVQLGDLGPYPGLMTQVVNEFEVIADFADPHWLPPRVTWRVDVAGVPYRDGNRIARLSGDLIPVEPVFTCDGWSQRYTAKAWLTGLGYYVGPPVPPPGNPFSRDEWLSFVLQSVGTVRDLRPLDD